MGSKTVEIKNIQNMLDRDQYLKPFESEVRRRYSFTISRTDFHTKLSNNYCFRKILK